MQANERSRTLLEWNRRHLIANQPLTVDMIAEHFHSDLTVVANGRCYETDHAGYLNFLDRFRKAIAAEENKVVLCMRAKISRIDEALGQFYAILLLKYNEKQKITLWHEVYVLT